jgi:predicted transposase YdaD
MLMTEWNLDDALAVRFEEGKEEVAMKALAKGLSIEVIHDITGLDMETIRSIQTGGQ